MRLLIPWKVRSKIELRSYLEMWSHSFYPSVSGHGGDEPVKWIQETEIWLFPILLHQYTFV